MGRLRTGKGYNKSKGGSNQKKKKGVRMKGSRKGTG